MNINTLILNEKLSNSVKGYNEEASQDFYNCEETS